MVLFKKTTYFVLLLGLLYVTLQGKKCKKDNNPPAPTGDFVSLRCYVGVYGKYPIGPCGSNTGPGPFSHPASHSGTCNSVYSSSSNQKHYTKVYVRYASESNYLREYCWNDAKSYLDIEVPTQIPLNKSLVIEFWSKEICTYCNPTGNGQKSRAVWVANHYFQANQTYPSYITLYPLWNRFESDTYCQ